MVIAEIKTPGVDHYVQAYTSYGNCGEFVYTIKDKKTYKLNTKTGEEIPSALPDGTHYHLNGNVYSTRHEWVDKYPRSLFYINGELVSKSDHPVGQDRTLYHDGHQWIMFIRSHPHTELKLSLQYSVDFIHWSRMREVDVHYLNNNEKIYSFCPFKIGREFYAIGNILTDGDNKLPYLPSQHLIYPVMFKSIQGRLCSWIRLGKLKLGGISIGKDFTQCSVSVSVKDSVIYLTTIESMRKHTTYSNIHEASEKPYSSKIYAFSPVSGKDTEYDKDLCASSPPFKHIESFQNG